MQILDKIEHINKGTSVALGYFDGVHIGHQAVISRAAGDAKIGLIPTVFTFDDNPQQSLTGKMIPRLTDAKTKENLLRNMGIELLLRVNFNSIKNISAEDFIEKILIGNLNAKRVYCGFNYHFGFGGKSGVRELKQFCQQRGIEVQEIPRVLVGGVTVSSSEIRKMISSGKIEQANSFLGRHFGYSFDVSEGRKLGRTIGIPTLNQAFPKDFILPKFGVYLSIVKLNGDTTWGVTNIGVKPTVGSEYPLSETWLPDYKCENMYGKSIDVELIKFIRPEKKFRNLIELKSAIKNDEVIAKRILYNENHLL